MSCSSTKRYYFYATLDSEGNKTKKDTSGFFSENKDSIKISYAFSGENITMNLNIQNKLPHPVSINWDKSHVQINDIMPKMYKNIHRKGHELDTSEITANSSKKYALLKDARYNFRQINKRKAKRQEKTVIDRNIKTKSLEFDSDNSPFILTSTLYLDADKENISRTLPFNNTFYLSSLNRVDKKEYKKIKKVSELRGDIFCIRYERERNSKFTNILLDTLIEAAFIIVDAKLNDGLDDE